MDALTTISEAVDLFGSAIAQNLPPGGIVNINRPTLTFTARSVTVESVTSNSLNISLGSQEINIPIEFLRSLGNVYYKLDGQNSQIL